MTAIAQNVSMYQGDTKSLVFTVTDDAGVAKDIRGATIRWVLQRWVTDAVPVLDKATAPGTGITITNGIAGICTVALAPADTLTLEGDYYWECEVTDTSTDVSTVAVGTMTILRSMA